MDFAGPFPELHFSEPTSFSPDPYLVDFARLGELIYYYTPAPSSSPNSTTSEIVHPKNEDPDLIIICSWMYAFSKHIAKYTNVYKSRFPSSHILLLRQDGGDFFYRFQSMQLKNLAPAVSTVKSLLQKKNESGGERLKVLMHVFSNGGAWTACQLSTAYSSTPHPSGIKPLLPIMALIFDSTPSLPHPTASHKAISEILPKKPAPLRFLGSIAVSAFITLAPLLSALTGTENVTLSIRRRLNDPDSAFVKARRRMYIYSQADELIPAIDVEAHAREARGVLGEEGGIKVTLEDFKTTRHVSHMMGDPERYWAVVEKAWKESIE